ncbi:MAG: rhomboid family intramembrane serine protease, partial [Paramuribaculum sp.]|nr:rhomboid family intramembrane serine protease [Paramuribaculum sp.]
LIQEGVWALTLPDTIINGLAQVNHVPRTQIEQYIAMNPGVMTDNLNYFTTVGASGSIYGVLLAFGMLYPNRPLYFMFIPVPVKAKYMVIIWILLELLLGVGAQADGIAHFAHLGGMIFGFLMIWYWMKKGIVHRENF